MQLASISKESLKRQNENLKDKFTDAAQMTDGLMVANGAALASGYLNAKMAGPTGNVEVFGMPATPVAGTALAFAALLGWVGKKGRKTALNVSIGLTAPHLEKLGRQLASSTK